VAAQGTITEGAAAMHRAPRRLGVTLTEVLVAIFICGLGLMALMTLFPLGAFNMAQALEDDRCGHAAANGAAILRTVWRVGLQTGGQAASPVVPGGLVVDEEFKNLEAELKNGAVYIDPIGLWTSANPQLGSIPRRGLGCLNPARASISDAYKWCTLLDDLEFEPSGLPRVLPAGNQISRNTRYSWAWMVRWLHQGGAAADRPDVPDLRALEFSVVVYHNRSMAGIASSELPLSATFSGTNQIIVGGGNSPIRKGSWVCDADRQRGYFYRVTKVDDGGTTLTVEPALRNTGGSGGGNIVVMDAVAEVFDRTTLE